MSLAKRLEEQTREQRISEAQADQILEARSEMWSGKGQGWLFSNVSHDKTDASPQENVADGR